MYCRKCGKQIGDDDKFCKECGCPTNGEILQDENAKPANSVSNTENSGFSMDRVQEIVGQKSFWLKEQLVAVIVSILTIFIPVLDFSVGSYGDKYSLWGLWKLVQRISDYDRATGSYFSEDIRNIKLLTAIPLLLSVVAAVMGVKYVYSFLQKRNVSGKNAIISIGVSLITVIVVWVYIQVMNNSLADVIDDFLSFTDFSRNGGIRLFSLTGYAIAEAVLMIFNLLYVIPKKIGFNYKWTTPDWLTKDNNLTNNENDNFKRRCPVCGRIIYERHDTCPQCGCPL